MQTIPDPKEWWTPAQAADSYRDRRGRIALRDGASGEMWAGNVYAETAVASWLRETVGRAEKGMAPIPMKPLPDWVRRWALPTARDLFLKGGDGMSEDILLLVRDPFIFDQVVADVPLAAHQAQMEALVALDRSFCRRNLRECGERYRKALANPHGFYEGAQEMAAADLGMLASGAGRYLVELVQWADGNDSPGAPVDLFTTAFIMGVASTYAHAQVDGPKPQDLGEIAIVWGLDHGPRKSVLRRWNHKAEQFRERMRAG